MKKTLKLLCAFAALALTLAGQPVQAQSTNNLSQAQVNSLKRQGLSQQDILQASQIVRKYNVGLDAVMVQYRKFQNWGKVDNHFNVMRNGDEPTDEVWTRQKLQRDFNITGAQIDSLRKQGLQYDGIASAAQVSQVNKVSLDAVMVQYRRLKNWNSVRAYFRQLRAGDTDDQMLRDRYNLSQGQINSLRKQGFTNAQMASAAQVAADENVSIDAVAAQWRRYHNWDKVRAHFRDLRDGNTDDDMLRNRYGLSTAQIASLRRQGFSNAEMTNVAMIAREEHVSVDAVAQAWKKFGNWNKVRAHFDDLRGKNRGNLDDNRLREVYGLSQGQILSLRKQGMSNSDIGIAAKIARERKISIDAVAAQWRRLGNWDKVRAHFKMIRPDPARDDQVWDKSHDTDRGNQRNKLKKAKVKHGNNGKKKGGG